MQDLRAQIEPVHSITRVLGPGGVGKTRALLETVRSSPTLARELLYAAKPGDVPAVVWSHLQSTPTAHCPLVIDEVNDVDAANLRNYFALTKDVVRLVMIGRDASRRSQPGTVRIDGPSQEVIVRAIEAVAPDLPKEAVREIAAACEGSPKMAVLA